MAECLVFARKLMKDDPPTLSGKRVGLTSLRNRPRGLGPAAIVAENIIDSGPVRRIEDGPYGGTPLTAGDERIGEMLTTPDNTNGETWGAVRSSDFSVAQVGYALSHSKLWLPNQSATPKVSVTSLNVVGRMGFVHRDIIGPAPRGPFDKVEASPTATYPALWNHDAKRETRMVCEPDSQLIVRIGMGSQVPRGLGYREPRAFEPRFSAQFPAISGRVHRMEVYRRYCLAQCDVPGRSV